jgi:NAD(P)-dependent dehydrogenase (short-subunit alcohol dehydrogenase family)
MCLGPRLRGDDDKGCRDDDKGCRDDDKGRGDDDKGRGDDDKGRGDDDTKQGGVQMDLQLSGKKALITGGSKGIGRATAEVLADEGCDVTLVAREQAALDAAAAAIRTRRQVNVRTISADLSSDAAVRRVAEQAGELDILVNNAGAIPPGDLLSVDDEMWRHAWDLKVFGYISFCRAIYARMKARRSGVIINVIGAAGESFPTGYIAGAAGNASLMAFTRALGKGAPADGLRVVAINPGPVETDRLVMLRRAEAQAKFGDPERWRELTASMAFGRAAKPAEIANAVAFLASPLSGYTTGTVLTINGGG